MEQLLAINPQQVPCATVGRRRRPAMRGANAREWESLRFECDSHSSRVRFPHTARSAVADRREDTTRTLCVSVSPVSLR